MTSKGALDYMTDRLALVDAAAAALKCRVDEVPARVENLQAELRETAGKLKKALTGAPPTPFPVPSTALSSSTATSSSSLNFRVSRLLTCATSGILCTRRSLALLPASSPA